MEQSPSSLNFLFRKQSILSYHPGININILPLLWQRKFWGQTGGDFCVWLSSLSQELCGVLLLQRRSCSGCLGIPGRAGHRDWHNSQQRQQLWGGGARGHSQPWPPLSTCAPTERQNPKQGFHSCPKNHISPTAIWKNPFLDSSTYSCPPWSSADTKNSINRRKESKSGAGKEPESTSGWVSKAAAAGRSLQ